MAHHSLNIPTQAGDVITSGYVLGYHLSRHVPDLAVGVNRAIRGRLLGYTIRR